MHETNRPDKLLPVQVFGQQELQEHIRSGGQVYSHLISITNPGRGRRSSLEDARMPEEFKNLFSRILRLRFYDVEEKAHLGSQRPKRIPERRDVRRVIRFVKQSVEEPDITGFTVHCWRGVSRSTAVALGVLHLLGHSESGAQQTLLEIRPGATPLPRIARFFDRQLGSNLESRALEIRQQFVERMRAELEGLEDELLQELEEAE